MQNTRTIQALSTSPPSLKYNKFNLNLSKGNFLTEKAFTSIILIKVKVAAIL